MFKPNYLLASFSSKVSSLPQKGGFYFHSAERETKKFNVWKFLIACYKNTVNGKVVCGDLADTLSTVGQSSVFSKESWRQGTSEKV